MDRRRRAERSRRCGARAGRGGTDRHQDERDGTLGSPRRTCGDRGGRAARRGGARSRRRVRRHRDRFPRPRRHRRCASTDRCGGADASAVHRRACSARARDAPPRYRRLLGRSDRDGRAAVRSRRVHRAAAGGSGRRSDPTCLTRAGSPRSAGSHRSPKRTARCWHPTARWARSRWHRASRSRSQLRTSCCRSSRSASITTREAQNCSTMCSIVLRWRSISGHIERWDAPGLGIDVDEDAVPRRGQQTTTRGAVLSGSTQTVRSPSGDGPIERE